MQKVIILTFLSVLIVFRIEAQTFRSLIQKNEITKIKDALEKDPSAVSSKDPNGAAPLHYAALYGKTEIIKLLLEKKAPVDPKDNDGSTPLHYASFAGKVEAAETLLNCGASLKEIDNRGFSPLNYAVTYMRKDAALLLINRGADINDEIKSNRITIHQAAECGLEKVVLNYISQKNNLPETDILGNTLLHSSVIGNLTNAVYPLLAKIFINSANAYGATPLHCAVKTGNTEMTRILIEQKADVNIKQKDGKTPFHIAQENGANDIITLMKNASADDTPYQAPEFKGEYFGFKAPGLKPEIFAPGFISTEDAFEFAISFSTDGRTALFTRRTTPADQRIWMTKIEGGKWTYPKHAPFTYDCFEFEPHFSADGKRLYYGSCRPLPGTNKLNENSDIWYIDLSKEGLYGTPEFFGKKMMFLSTSPDGSVYYTALRDDFLKNRIAVKKMQNGVFGEEIMLNDSINYVERAAHPCIDPNGSFIIFDGMGLNGDAGDLYISFKKENGGWTKAVNMGPEINSSLNEMTPSLSPDGKYLFFNRNSDPYGDIFWVDIKIIDQFKPLKSK